jgi:hypothetical protein
VTVAGETAYMFEVKAKVEGIDAPILYVFTFVKGKESLYMVMSWTLSTSETEYKDVLKKMNKSIKEI